MGTTCWQDLEPLMQTTAVPSKQKFNFLLIHADVSLKLNVTIDIVHQETQGDQCQCLLCVKQSTFSCLTTIRYSTCVSVKTIEPLFIVINIFAELLSHSKLAAKSLYKLTNAASKSFHRSQTNYPTTSSSYPIQFRLNFKVRFTCITATHNKCARKAYSTSQWVTLLTIYNTHG